MTLLDQVRAVAEAVRDDTGTTQQLLAAARRYRVDMAATPAWRLGDIEPHAAAALMLRRIALFESVASRLVEEETPRVH